MRISQEFSKNIANKMAEKLDKKIELAEKEYSEFVYKEYVKQTPKGMLVALKKYPNYVQTVNYVYFSGFGFNYEGVSVVKKVIEQSSNSRANLTLDKDLAGELIKFKRVVDDLKKERAELKREIQNALLTLRSFSEIKKQFPEAAKYLPNAEKRELVVDLQSIRNKLKTA